jgi:ATP-binding cassette, subfamily B, bacterial
MLEQLETLRLGSGVTKAGTQHAGGNFNADVGRASSAPVQAPVPAADQPPAQERLRRLDQLRPLAQLKPYILRYPRMVAVALAALVASSLTMLALPIAVRRMIDVGFVGADGAFINQYFLAIIGLGIMLAVASASRFFAVNWLGERVVADMRADVFRHLLSLDAAFHDRSRSGELMSRLTADTTQLKSASGSSLSQALRNTIMLLGALAMMIITSPMLTLVVLVGLIGVVVPLLAAGRAVRARSRDAQDSLADAAAYAQENLSAIRTVQSAATEDHVAARFGAAVEASFTAARDRLSARALLTAGTIALIVTCLVGILWFGATRVVAGDMSGGRLGQFILYALFAGAAIAELSEVWGELSQAAGAAERLSELLAFQPEIAAPREPLTLPEPSRGSIAFEDVSFQYPGRDGVQAIHALSFQVQTGETIALVGPSGAGKSTVFALLQRFYDPGTGTVRIDGVAVSKVDPRALRRRMALVPQDIAIFADTIANNIRYGRPDAADADIRHAARLARVDTFAQALPSGYDTLVGERGVTLSGGQRQRIGLARAILRDAPILLLDEATSALDAGSEADVQAALEAVMSGRTTIVIAHRLATVKKADRILVLDQGRLVEQGTHASLVAAGGLYAKLASLQFLDAAPEPAAPGVRS